MRQPRLPARAGILIVLLPLCAGALVVSPPAHGQTPVTFQGVDDGVISADLYGDGPRGVILAHGGRFDKESWAPQARVLSENRFRVLALDFRGRGESRGGWGGPEALYFDVMGAVRFLRDAGATGIALVGASLGGWAVAEAVVRMEPGEVDRVVLLAHSPIEEPERLTGAKLFIVSRGDTTGSGVSRLRVIRDQFDRAPEPKRLVILEGSAHAQLLFLTDQARPLLREMLAFLAERAPAAHERSSVCVPATPAPSRSRPVPTPTTTASWPGNWPPPAARAKLTPCTPGPPRGSRGSPGGNRRRRRRITSSPARPSASTRRRSGARSTASSRTRSGHVSSTEASGR